MITQGLTFQSISREEFLLIEKSIASGDLIIALAGSILGVLLFKR